MNALVTLGIVVYSIICVLLILLIIIQGGKAEGLFSSAQANVLGSQRGNALTKATTVLAAIFVLGALLISMAISGQKTAFESASGSSLTPSANAVNTNMYDEERRRLAENVGEDITVDTVPEGLVLRLGDILFNTDSYVLRDEARESIDRIVRAIKENYPDREIIVKGHTDNVGDPEYNQTLSENRAKSVADYILPNLNHNRLSYSGSGDKEPLSSNDTPEGRRRNRRVDIIINLR